MKYLILDTVPAYMYIKESIPFTIYIVYYGSNHGADALIGVWHVSKQILRVAD